ncbi:MAG TPA: ATP synthase F1 subunit epsilon [Candidatus Wunengus sp. YC63]|uniref:ATP synthase F1 subunit epsilon n=1 Tax=Candidatus Wunengus sp. YC63 TaxID=3367699 RepID=UPI0027142BA2|nr:ATP synthase F1 subunit epsilon [Candidatus Brocadiales bacterium]
MAKTFTFEIITPEKVVYSDSVESVVADGTEGSFGVLAGHAPLITAVQTSILTVTDANNKTVRFAIDGGFLEVMTNNVIVLTDTCLKEGEVDIEKARSEKDSAEKAILKVGSASEKEKAQAALKRANTWLKLANK